MMAKKRIAVEFGMGTSLRKQDYTGAAVRALKDALWHNSLALTDTFGFKKEEMLIDIEIGVQRPSLIRIKDLKKILPYGKSTFKVVKGGLDIIKPDGKSSTVIANVAVIISFNMERVNVR
jgi:uncharacterized protein (TIGR02058 family)